MGPTRLGADQAGGVRAVDCVAEGKEGAVAFEAEIGMGGEELSDEVGVFLGFEATGAVDEDAAGF